MTNNELIASMLDRHAFTQDTLITARYLFKTVLGESWSTGLFYYREARFIPEHNYYVFDLERVEDHNTCTVGMEHVISIDGMDPSRFADVYDLNFDGTVKNRGKKRGRKSKQNAAVAAAAA
jgi:hypothetical protein